MSEITTTKGTLVQLGEAKPTKNGGTYTTAIFNNHQREGIMFWTGQPTIKVGDEVEYSIKEGNNPTTPIFNLKKDKPFAGGYRSPGIDKNVEALKLAVQLACADKIELKNLVEWKDYLKSLM